MSTHESTFKTPIKVGLVVSNVNIYVLDDQSSITGRDRDLSLRLRIEACDEFSYLMVTVR